MSEYAYAALLLHSAKKEINEENVRKVLEAVGIQPDEAKIKALVASLEGVNIDEVLQQAITFAAPVAQEQKEEKKEEEKKEEEEGKSLEEAAAGLSALFG